ncbi:hypothetical protein P175DRAFT_0498972 [Aspergillus ochraceoroseus IBT 24754]|uniref:Uncharacterized protein n=2 Tax=Aspergillus ochraceoroseus TaxID=138278 RepID=A0A2T5M1N0_9EURO|nr:uncharacterized protein P175DRAFT_0498972 [Aspergillus ochraceoroseus IBT 24754]KKK18924.1 hypothetical protein AOCH_005976 [Aspergillus ochraceoroseus]PTU22437.1 hypothetical protein P175DRAFT_0498972 [Aspergillus ochraceoroseus IBT 24754]
MDSSAAPEMLRKVSSQRVPPPALFQGPPSHNASNLSVQPPVPMVVTPGGQAPPRPLLNRNRSSKPLDTHGALSPFLSRTQSKGEIDGSDALWEEMQSALSDVEVSAAARGHVFGEKHSEALEDLRMKHLWLAQAWARSEAEDEVVESKPPAAQKPPFAKMDSRTTGPAGQTPGEADSSSRNLDEETEKDILLARDRREANDRYFDRVNNGVLDVVAKLEEIAQAMRTMETESKDIWSDDDSMSTATLSTVHSEGAET